MIKPSDAEQATWTDVTREYVHDLGIANDGLRKALDGLVLVCGRTGDPLDDFEEQAERFQRDTGKMRPGKDVPEMAPDLGATRGEYSEWVRAKVVAVRAALKEETTP